MNEAPTTHRPKLIRTEFGFAVTDGAESFPFDTFNEARDMAKLAAAEGMDAVAEALFGPDDYYIEDEDGSEAYARMLERRSEAGTWWGRDYGDPDY
jgi:hypothetical protein